MQYEQLNWLVLYDLFQQNKLIDIFFLFKLIYKLSSLSNVDKTERHSLEINVLGSINWIKSCIDIITNKRSIKCYKQNICQIILNK